MKSTWVANPTASAIAHHARPGLGMVMYRDHSSGFGSVGNGTWASKRRPPDRRWVWFATPAATEQEGVPSALEKQ
jgi:hypothetical protein